MNSVTEKFNGVERAALVLLALGQQRASEVLKHLEVRDVELLGSHMASMKAVSLARVEGVLDQFMTSRQKQAAIGGDAEDYVRGVMADALGTEKAEAMIDRVLLGGRNAGIQRLQRMDARTLADWLRSEHPQVAANLLSLLDGQRAADVIMALPEEIRPNLLMRIASLEGVSPEALRELDEVIREQWDGKPNDKSSRVRGINVAANILNHLDNPIGNQVLDAISASHFELAQKIQDKLFVFEELINLNGRGIQSLLREVATDRLLLALQGASESLKQKIFSNMSRRTAEMLRDDLEAAPPARPGEVAAAQKEILLIVRSLADSGAVVFGGDEGEFN
ncbi:flagellar motor switch protein FliG [Methylomicrobium lacus]|uniref:flagellar motor switch protein FliG n=1 Tax=Methylomicrobium lacus TaxID=136992 RepID=UPI0035A93DD8